jgi:dipeptidyl-peptidase 4
MPVRLTIDTLFSGPGLSGQVPLQCVFAPDGRSVTFVASATDDRDRLDLYRYDADSRAVSLLIDARRLSPADQPMSDEEKAQQERRRSFSSGIVDYAWHPDGTRMVLVSGGGAFLFDVKGDALRRLTPADTRQTDVRFSPNGRFIGYVRAGDLYVFDLAADGERRLTEDASDTVTNGLAEFIAQEEMHRFEGYWFSRDERYLAYTRVDTGPVAVTHRYEIDADQFNVFPQRYPFAGATNAHVDLVLLDLETGERRRVPYRDGADDYLARADFSSDHLCVQVQSRDQRRLVLKAFDVSTLAATTLLEETAKTWINLHDNLRFLPNGRDFIWTSQRDDHAHLYLHREHASPTALTTGAGRVNAVHFVDDEQVCFSGWFERPVEQHAYRVRFAEPGRLERLTTEPGWHEVRFSTDGSRFVARSSTLMRTPRLAVGDTHTAETVAFGGNALQPGHPYWPYLDAHCEPELGSLETDDGHALWYRLTRPFGFDPARRHPVIVLVYGGPGVQRVRNEWAPLTLQLLAQHGYSVFELDNRGSGNRAKSFEDPIHGCLGHVEVEDQLRGVEFLKRQAWVDPDRIGIFGHSYGGYMTLMCLCQAPEVFRSGVSVAPVTDWTLYDTHYTERYLGKPAVNADGYSASAVVAHVAGLRGALLVIHGMADDNVLFTHSTRLFKWLQDRRLPFEMMTYPGAKHALQQPDVAIHRYMTILDFFARTLGGQPPRASERHVE